MGPSRCPRGLRSYGAAAHPLLGLGGRWGRHQGQHARGQGKMPATATSHAFLDVSTVFLLSGALARPAGALESHVKSIVETPH